MKELGGDRKRHWRNHHRDVPAHVRNGRGRHALAAYRNLTAASTAVHSHLVVVHEKRESEPPLPKALLACHRRVRVERCTLLGRRSSADGHRRSLRHEAETASRTGIGKRRDCAWGDSAGHSALVLVDEGSHGGMPQRLPELSGARLARGTAGAQRQETTTHPGSVAMTPRGGLSIRMLPPGRGLPARLSRRELRLRKPQHVLVLGAGMLMMSVMLARGFGRFHGGLELSWATAHMQGCPGSGDSAPPTRVGNGNVRGAI